MPTISHYEYKNGVQWKRRCENLITKEQTEARFTRRLGLKVKVTQKRINQIEKEILKNSQELEEYKKAQRRSLNIFAVHVFLILIHLQSIWTIKTE